MQTQVTITGAELASIILAFATLVAAIAAAAVSLRTATKLDAVHTAVNGTTAHLVALTAASSFAEGALASGAAVAPTARPGVAGVVGAPPPSPSS